MRGVSPVYTIMIVGIASLLAAGLLAAAILRNISENVEMVKNALTHKNIVWDYYIDSATNTTYIIVYNPSTLPAYVDIAYLVEYNDGNYTNRLWMLNCGGLITVRYMVPVNGTRVVNMTYATGIAVPAHTVVYVSCKGYRTYGVKVFSR